MHNQVIALGNAVFSVADLFAFAAHFSVLSAEGTAAVNTKADRVLFAAGKLAEKAFLDLAGSGVDGWHFNHARIWREW
jgi:hypothetical protein